MEYVKKIYGVNIEDLPVDSYLREIPFLKNFKGMDIDSPVTFFVGENGTGKSTLLEALAVRLGFNAEGGSKNFNFATKKTHSILGEILEIGRGPGKERDGFFLRAESFYNLASEVDNLAGSDFSDFYDSYGGKSLHFQSHGESFRSLILN
ncbi:MAG: AAA family ATPase, partial [Peptoniphilus grossensis]